MPLFAHRVARPAGDGLGRLAGGVPGFGFEHLAERLLSTMQRGAIFVGIIVIAEQ